MNIDNKPKVKVENGFKILYSNVDQLPNKHHELCSHVSNIRPDLIQLTEIYPKNLRNTNRDDNDISICDTLFKIPGYELVINKNPIRGIALYYRSDIDVTICEEINTLFSECMWCSTTIGPSKFLFGCVYRDQAIDKTESLNNVIHLLNNANLPKYDKVIITGDFNLPNFDWINNTNITKAEEDFLDCLNDHFLEQLITEPTRHREKQKSNILDLVLTNDDTAVNDIEHRDPLGKSDHEVLVIELSTQSDNSKSCKDKYNFFKSDFASLQEHLDSIDWSEIVDMDTDDAWLFFKNTLHNAYIKYVPKCSPKHKKQPIWLNNKSMKLIKRKYNLYKRYCFSHKHYDFQKYIEARNGAKSAIRKSVKEYEKKVAKESKTNSKGFWKYINSKLSRTSGISPLLKPDGSLTDTDDEKAHVLNDFFTSVFTKEDTTSMPVPNDNSDNKYTTDLIITREAVENKLSKLNPSKAMGPDHIPNVILKTLAKELSLPISIIFNKSISEGCVPEDWRMAEVTAIFKKGSRNDPGNYRPVSLTSVLCKVLESFVRDQITNHMESNNLYSKCQHGFRSRRSCVTQLLEVMDNFTTYFENKENFDVLYLDFRKAFDTVPHGRLLSKLNAYGINGNILRWVQQFLSNRKQRVKVNSSYSPLTSVDSGIPQGSVLGPVLFVIFINDLPDCVSSSCKIFADDTKIYGPSTDSKSIQEDLYKLMEWSELWQLKFNTSKCSVLHYGKNNVTTDYFMDKDKNHKLKVINSEKDVGVTFSSNLKFEEHINNIINKSNKFIGLIKKAFCHLDRDMFLQLYKSLVRSHLEYANVIWHSRFKGQNKRIEKVQRRATKILPELQAMSYGVRLEKLKLPSIKYRQIRSDLIQAYNIMHANDNLDVEQFFTFNNSNTRNNSLKVYKQSACSGTRSNFFSNRVFDFWNRLSGETKMAKNKNDFKKGIDLELHSLKYDFYD